jgi:hypothetical protein
MMLSMLTVELCLTSPSVSIVARFVWCLFPPRTGMLGSEGGVRTRGSRRSSRHGPARGDISEMARAGAACADRGSHIIGAAVGLSQMTR